MNSRLLPACILVLRSKRCDNRVGSALLYLLVLLLSYNSSAQLTVTSIHLSPSSVIGGSAGSPTTMTVTLTGNFPDSAVYYKQPTGVAGLGGPFDSKFTVIGSPTAYTLSTNTVSSSVVFTITSPGGASDTITVTPLQMTLGGRGTVVSGGSWIGALTFNAPLYIYTSPMLACDSTFVNGEVNQQDMPGPTF